MYQVGRPTNPEGRIISCQSSRASYHADLELMHRLYSAGVDAARAFATGCFVDHRTHDIRGLSERELKVGWTFDSY